jgi:hypothetical protein
MAKKKVIDWRVYCNRGPGIAPDAGRFFEPERTRPPGDEPGNKIETTDARGFFQQVSAISKN